MLFGKHCISTAEQLDEQLTRFAEKDEIIVETRKKCVEFEEALISDANTRINCIEIDVRSWTLNDAGMFWMFCLFIFMLGV